MQHQILINVIIFVAYVLNLLLNTQRSHSRSQRAGKWSLILAHYRRPIYRAPTYIAVPLLGPHQPRYIGLTLYFVSCRAWHWRSISTYQIQPDLAFVQPEFTCRQSIFKYQCTKKLVFCCYNHGSNYFLKYSCPALLRVWKLSNKSTATSPSGQLELECQHSENTPCHPMITHTIDSYGIPSKNKTKSKLQMKKNCQNSNFGILQKKNFTCETPLEVAW